MKISNHEFDFGKSFVGSTAVIESIISNVGAIPAILILDLTQHQDFRIEYSPELAENVGSEKVNSITLISDNVFCDK